MSLPLATTTIRIERPSETGVDALDPPAEPDVVATGVRAVFSSPQPGASAARSASAGEGDGDQTAIWRLSADPCDLRHTDTVVDESTEVAYLVAWAVPRESPVLDEELGGDSLDHVVAVVHRIDGASP